MGEKLERPRTVPLRDIPQKRSEEVDILRVIEEGFDRMRFDKIRTEIKDYYEAKGQDILATQMIHHQLRNPGRRDWLTTGTIHTPTSARENRSP